MYLYRQKGRLTWRIRWKKGGQVLSTSTGHTDLDDATRVLMAMRAAQEGRADERRLEALLRAAFATRGRRGMPLADVAAEYRAAVPETKHARLAGEHWLKFAAWVSAHRPGVETLQDLDPAACRAYVSAIAGTPKTVANTIGDCARIYRVVAPVQGISGDPWRGIRISREKSKAPRGLTVDEAERLLAAAKGQYRGAILVGLYTGLRYHDVAFLRWSEVHGKTIRLQPIKTSAHGIRVTVPIHPTLARYLASLDRDGEFVFPELASTYNQRCTARRFMYARRDAGLPPELTFHSLRHSVVTWMALAKVAEDVRMRVVGHSNAATHSDYTHDDAEQRAAIEALPAGLGEPKGTAARGIGTSGGRK